MYALKRTLDTLILAIIAAHRSSPGEQDNLLSMLIAAEDEETGAGMTDEHIRDEAVTMFIAGHETTSTALS